jgi:hypothetical protein
MAQLLHVSLPKYRKEIPLYHFEALQTAMKDPPRHWYELPARTTIHVLNIVF